MGKDVGVGAVDTRAELEPEEENAKLSHEGKLVFEGTAVNIDAAAEAVRELLTVADGEVLAESEPTALYQSNQ